MGHGFEFILNSLFLSLIGLSSLRYRKSVEWFDTSSNCTFTSGFVCFFKGLDGVGISTRHNPHFLNQSLGVSGSIPTSSQNSFQVRPGIVDAGHSTRRRSRDILSLCGRNFKKGQYMTRVRKQGVFGLREWLRPRVSDFHLWFPSGWDNLKKDTTVLGISQRFLAYLGSKKKGGR